MCYVIKFETKNRLWKVILLRFRLWKSEMFSAARNHDGRGRTCYTRRKQIPKLDQPLLLLGPVLGGNLVAPRLNNNTTSRKLNGPLICTTQAHYNYKHNMK